KRYVFCIYLFLQSHLSCFRCRLLFFIIKRIIKSFFFGKCFYRFIFTFLCCSSICLRFGTISKKVLRATNPRIYFFCLFFYIFQCFCLSFWCFCFLYFFLFLFQFFFKFVSLAILYCLLSDFRCGRLWHVK